MIRLSRVAHWVFGTSLGLLACAEGPPDSPSSPGTDGEPGPIVGGGGLADGSPPGSALGSGGGPVIGDSDSALLPARVWRLSHEQYRKSVVALTGMEPDLSNFAPESGNGKFTTFSSTAFVQVDLAGNYYNVAKTIASEIATQKLAALTSCPLTASCRDDFIRELAGRAFRTPLTPETREGLNAVFDLASAQATVESGFRAVLAAVLNSPLFLYRKEIGPETALSSAEFELTPHQVAEFLSFSLLDAPPPAWLGETADAGLLNPKDLASVLQKLMDEPDFTTALHHFLTEWLEVAFFDQVQKSDVFPGFDAARPLMQSELHEFFRESGAPERGLRNLLLDPVPPVSPALENFYSSDPSAPAATPRIGILALGSVLASHAKSYLTSPTLRGLFVRARLFCQDVSLPPGFTPPPLSETEGLKVARSTRELYERHAAEPLCASCHELTDNIGFALEAFDGAGRSRSLDATQGFQIPLNTTAELVDTDVDRLLTGPGDLSVALSESSAVKECFARQAFRFYFGQEERRDDEPAIIKGRDSILQEDTLRALTLGLFMSETTAKRGRGGGEN